MPENTPPQNATPATLPPAVSLDIEPAIESRDVLKPREDTTTTTTP